MYHGAQSSGAGGHVVWTSASATCSLHMTVPLFVDACAVWPVGLGKELKSHCINSAFLFYLFIFLFLFFLSGACTVIGGWCRL